MEEANEFTVVLPRRMVASSLSGFFSKEFINESSLGGMFERFRITGDSEKNATSEPENINESIKKMARANNSNIIVNHDTPIA